MVIRTFQIMRSWPGAIAATLVGVVVLGPLLAVIWWAGGVFRLEPADWSAARFTVVQAMVSAVISVALAIPVARALARRKFIGRSILITVLGAPFILPVIVAVMGLLAVFGRNGVLNDVLRLVGLPEIQVYGFHGVILAHVFLNLPLATRMILQGWQSIPAERFRLAASLGMGAGPIMRRLELPMLRAVLPGAFLVIFALCLSSFAVALTLGGGPRATTVELAIYQAFRYDFDLGRAALLAIVQVILVGTTALVAVRLSRADGLGAGMARGIQRWDSAHRGLLIQDGFAIVGAAAFLVLPLAMIVAKGGAGLDGMPMSVWRSAGVSIGVALCSTLIVVVLALPIGRVRGAWASVVTLLGMAVSPLVIGTGAFILINPVADPARLALPITAVVNAVMALPFVLRILGPEMQRAEVNFARLADSLRITGWARLRWVILPAVRRPLGFAAGLTAALSMGDLGVIALFAAPDHATLPLQILRLMGAYKMEAAAGAGLVLLVLSLGVFWIFDKGGRGNAEA